MSLFSLMATLGLDSSGYDKGLDEAEGKTESFGSKLKSGLSNAAKIGGAAITAASGAVVALGTASVKTGMEFDSAMSQIAATLGITTEDIQNNVNGAGDTFTALRDKAKEMGAATNFSASQAADGLNILAMSGFQADESIAMVEDVLHLAAAGSMDMASAAGFLSGAIKGFAGSAEDAGYYADLMAKGATLANTSVSQLGEAMSSGAAGAAAYGQQADSMTIALLRLAEQGDVGAAAGTALSAAMKNLYTPTDQAKKALEELGVAAYDESGTARDFNDVVNELSGALSGMSAEQQAAYKSTIFGIQGLDAFNKMTVTGIEKQEQWADALAHASDGIGETAKQYNTMTDNLQGDLDILSSSFDGLKIAISDTLMDSTRQFVQFGSDALSAITAGFEEGGIAGAMDALGGVLSDGIELIFSKLPEVVDAGMQLLQALVSGIVDNADMIIQAVFDVLLTIGNALTQNPGFIIEGVESVLMSLMSWLGEYSGVLVDTMVQLVIGMLMALTNPEAIGELFTEAEFLISYLVEALLGAIPQLLEVAPVIIENLVTAITENVYGLIGAGVLVLETLINGVTDNLPLLVDTVGTVIDTISQVLTEYAPYILEEGVKLLGTLIEGLMESLPDLLAAMYTIMTAIPDLIMENLPMILEMGIELIGVLAEGFLDNLPAILGAITDILLNLAGYLLDFMPEILQLGLDLITNLAMGMVENLPAIINAVLAVITTIVGWILDNLPEIVQMGIDLVFSLAQGLIENLPAVIDAITEIVFSLVGWVMDNLPMIIDTGIELVFALVDGLIENLPALISAALDLMMGIIEGLLDNIPLLIETAIELMVQLAVGLVQAIPQLVARIPEIITGIVDAFINFDWAGLGGSIIEGIKNGILNIGSTLWEGVKSVGQGLLNGFKSLFGIASPSKVFREQVGKMIGEGLAEGIEESAKDAVNAAESMAEDVIGEMDTLNGFGMDMTANLSAGGGYGYGSTDNRSVVINVYGAEGQDVNELAEIISEKMAFQYRQEQMAWA